MAPPPSPVDAPCREARLRDGGRFSYTDEGDGPVVVAVHGLPGSARDFRWLAGALHGVRLVRLELPGFGGTPLATAPGTSLAERGHFVAAALEALELERCVLLGHSMGGGVALAAAALHPARVAALALVASIGLRPHRAFRRLLAPRALAVGVDLPLVGRPLRALAWRGFQALGFSSRVTHDEVAHTLRCVAATRFEHQATHAAALRVPTLVAWADDDAFVEPAVSEALAAALPSGPRLHWPTGGHALQKSRATELAEALTQLARAETASTPH